MEFTDLSFFMQETDENIQRQVDRSGSAFYYYYYYYYYYAAFNAPCVGHKADESQAINL